MKELKIEISSFLRLLINFEGPIDKVIKSRFRDAKDCNDSYDYELYFTKKNEIICKPLDFKKIYPFRNSNYFVKKTGDIITAYSPNQPFQEENLIIREKNKLKIEYINDEIILIRIITELFIRKLLQANFFPLHASAIVENEKCKVFIGGKNSGKTLAMLKNIIKDGNYPLANDIIFVGKMDNKWIAYGIPYDVTIDSDVLYELSGLNYNDNIEKWNSKKIRINPQKLEELFSTKWITCAEIGEINLIKLSKEENFKIENNISKKLALNFLEKYGKDDNFRFGDYLLINGLEPKYDYLQLIKDVNINYMSGNIIKGYEKAKCRLKH